MSLSLTQNFFDSDGSLIVKMLTYLLPICSFVLTSIGLQIDWQYVALAGGGSLAGSVILSYFRREKTKNEQLYKIVVSAIGGLIVGSAIVTYRELVQPSYIALTFFICSMLVLIILRVFIKLTETNAATFTTTLIQRIFNVKLEKSDGETIVHRPKGNGGKRRSENIQVQEHDDGPPTVVIGDKAKPDEVKVIEQTVIETKEGQ